MNCKEIETIINELKIDTRGYIRGKSKAINKIHQEHLKKIDSELMDIRVCVAKISTGHSVADAMKMIDEFLYKKQTS